MSTDAASSTSLNTSPVLPTDPQQLRELAQRLLAREAEHAARETQLAAELAQAAKTLVEQQQRLEKLGHELSMMKRLLYGARRERFTSDDPRQKTLFEV